MKKLHHVILIAGIFGWASSPTAPAAESISVLLQKGIFAEETEGNLDAAIRIYEQITAETVAQRSVVAQAHYRLGVCHQKKGNKEQAISALNELLKEFPAETALGQKARELLAGLGQAPENHVSTRRVLANAFDADAVLTAKGKFIRGLIISSGDIVQFDVASGLQSRIKNLGPWSEQDSWLERCVFSRDGGQIVFNSYSAKDVPHLQVRNLDGSASRTLLEEEGSWSYPLDWSPDGGSILAVTWPGKGGPALAIISVADGSMRVLRRLAEKPRDAYFSPDGQSIAFGLECRGSPPQGYLFVTNLAGQEEVAIASHPAEDKLLGWTPDGKRIIFLSDRSGTWDIWTVPITGGKQQGEPELQKKNFGWDSDVLGVASDGSMYYRTYTSLGRLYQAEVDLETGKVLAPPAPVTTRYTGPQMFLRWSPDGTNLAYVSNLGPTGPGNNILTIRSATTGEERLVSTRLRGVGQPSWAPDGLSIIAAGYSETGNGIYRIDTETGGETLLRKGEGWNPYLCPDGKTLLFSKNGIKKRNLDTGEESLVVKANGHFDLSPGGREVVFQVTGVVKVMAINGGEPRELFRGSAQHYGLKWTRDGRYVLALAYRTVGAANREIWRIPAQGGTALKLELSVPKLYSIALHPDNRRFAYCVGEMQNSELWVLENFLPKKPPAGM